MIPVIAAHDKLLPKNQLERTLPLANFLAPGGCCVPVYEQIDQFIDSCHGFDTA
jgi:hypothetical protein